MAEFWNNPILIDPHILGGHVAHCIVPSSSLVVALTALPLVAGWVSVILPIFASMKDLPYQIPDRSHRMIMAPLKLFLGK